MSDPAFAKCSCQSCGVHLEYPVEAEGTRIACPQCGQQTQLVPPPGADVPPVTPALSIETIDAAFAGVVLPTPVSFFYRLGLLVVTVTMVILPLIYIAMIGAAGWAVYYWATHFTHLLSVSKGRGMIVMLFAYLTPLFAGAVLVFFMVKPLFARRAPHARPLALNPGAEPLLFAFVTRLCQAVGAPFPNRIDIDCELNAAASFRRGLFSFLGNDLVLTIGLPLAASLNLREFAGVLAHEFGHFTQGFGMRLTYVIRTINSWFARVVYERDAWDVMLEEGAQTEDWRLGLLIGVARLGVGTSRLMLRVLMWIGHGIGCFMLRQMEYDADSYEIKLAGSEAFEATMRRFHVLGATLTQAHKDMRTSWNLNKRLPDNFPLYFTQYSERMHPAVRTQLEDTMGLEPSGLFDTHPSNGDRIRKARQAGEPGIFHLDGPAAALFSNFDVPARQVTLIHYQDDLGVPLEMTILTAVETAKAASLPAAELPESEFIRTDAIEPIHGNSLRLKQSSPEQS